MTITARGVAIFCGILLGGFGALGLLIRAAGTGEQYFPPCELAHADRALPRRGARGRSRRRDPRGVGADRRVVAHVSGLALYAAVTGNRWLDVSGRGTHENFAALFLVAVMAVHAFVFLAGGWRSFPSPRHVPRPFKCGSATSCCWSAG
jgi:hypothetical protein